ncbi:MAG: hypothetical protein ACRDWH_08195 [Acidimicrobiia bacterium]
MIALTNEAGLIIASAVPVVVIGWAMLFSVEAARRGPGWSLPHLGVVSNVLGLGLALAVAATLLIRPVWVGLGAAYPIAVGLVMTTGRRRQMMAVERELGFGDVGRDVRDRTLSKLRQGLWVVAGLSVLIAASLAGVGVVQGWVVAALAPIALIALVRSRRHQVEAPAPPSL